MRITCPFCGTRSLEEFLFRGSAEAPLAALDAAPEARFAAVYLRDNPAGLIEEYCYHAQGCRSWLIVTRDTRTHRIEAVRLAKDATP